MGDLMDLSPLVVSGACTLEETDLVIGVPACVPDLAPKQDVTSWNAIGGIGVAVDSRGDFSR
jgi:hypothetical protein